MRKATEKEQAFFDRVKSHPVYEFLVWFFAIHGFAVFVGFVVTLGTGHLSVFRTVLLVMIGMWTGYAIHAIKTERNGSNYE